MGLFDTLVMEPPLICPRCGTVHQSIQTKNLESSMSTYRPGMLIPMCPVHTGLLNEWTYCYPKSADDDDRTLKVWIIIWHGVYAGHALDLDTASRKLDGLDRLDILAWLDRMQKTALEWRNRYNALYSDIRDWLELRDMKPQTAGSGEGRDRFRELLASRIPEEIRKDPDPLRRLLERNAPDQIVDHGFFGW